MIMLLIIVAWLALLAVAAIVTQRVLHAGRIPMVVVDRRLEDLENLSMSMAVAVILLVLGILMVLGGTARAERVDCAAARRYAATYTVPQLRDLARQYGVVVTSERKRAYSRCFRRKRR